MLTYLSIPLAFVAVFAAVVALGRHLSGRPSADQRRAARRLRDLNRDSLPDAAESPSQSRRIGGVVSAVGVWVLRRYGKQTDALRARLSLAGLRRPSATTTFTGAQLVLAGGLAVLAGAVAATGLRSWSQAVLWATVGGTVGFLAPRLILARLIARRQRLVRNALPDALDILVLGTEGGASLNAALQWVTEEVQPVHPELGAEMAAVQNEIQLGLSAGEAVNHLADRCGLPEVKDLASAIRQGERYGASMAKTLRAYSDNARQERQVWAEEMAQKAAVKILFPMLLCIFPAMFIVLLGPAAFQMSRLFAR